MPPVRYLSRHFKNNSLPQFQVGYLITEDYSRRHTRQLHTHDDLLELLFIESGSGKYSVDGTLYDVKSGDIVINNAGILHGEVSEDANRRMRTYSIHMRNVALVGLPDNTLTARNERPILSVGMLKEQVASFFQLTYLLSSNDSSLQEVCSSISTSILLLCRELLASRARHEITHARTSASDTADRIRTWINLHYREDLTLKKISDSLHISEYYLAHVFKDEYDISPMQYIAKRRIGEAQTLLTDTDAPIGEIADLLGYCNVCHFNAMFRKHVGTPPGQFRKNMRNMGTSGS